MSVTCYQDKKGFKERSVYPGLQFEGGHSVLAGRCGSKNRRLASHCSQETGQEMLVLGLSSPLHQSGTPALRAIPHIF